MTILFTPRYAFRSAMQQRLIISVNDDDFKPRGQIFEEAALLLTFDKEKC